MSDNCIAVISRELGWQPVTVPARQWPAGHEPFWGDGFSPPANLDGAYLRRWNGRAGLIADGFIEGPPAQSGRNLLWMERPQMPVLVEAAQGEGQVLISKLAFRGRLDPADPAYDPAAERLLLGLLEPSNAHAPEKTP